MSNERARCAKMNVISVSVSSLKRSSVVTRRSVQESPRISKHLFNINVNIAHGAGRLRLAKVEKTMPAKKAAPKKKPAAKKAKPKAKAKKK
ncbi:MAG TPA: hypothetical protein VMB46_06030 [Methanomassiliicoccales archaeon]|nr:hypothetical protein [Methanomassiliicoccales archaeon]